jgi:hypothetical protein
MSSTRKSADSGAFNQERFASGSAFEEGLLGNLVARRVALLQNPEDRELVLFLQAESNKPGGLSGLADTVLAQYSDRVGTPAMTKLKTRGISVCGMAEIIAIRRELGRWQRNDFVLPSEALDIEAVCGSRPSTRTSVPMEEFDQLCRSEASRGLPDYLRDICLNPSSIIGHGEPWYMPDLRACLVDYLEQQAKSVASALVMTDTTRRIWDALEYARAGGCMVLVDGLSRIGKTWSAKTWCDARPGRARYVQVPSTSDDLTFFRSIAKALGVGSGLSMKGLQMRERVEQTLQLSKIMLVLDEAHYLWPQNNRREALPGRLNWIMTALVNHGVPVGLVTTPQFSAQQRVVETKTGWASEQFTGRMAHYEKLPDTLSEAELMAVARCHLPEGDRDMLEAVVGFARSSAKYLSGIEHAVKRARFLATKNGRKTVCASDLLEAIEGSSLPSLVAVKASAPERRTRQGRIDGGLSVSPVKQASGTNHRGRNLEIHPEPSRLHGIEHLVKLGG